MRKGDRIVITRETFAANGKREHVGIWPALWVRQAHNAIVTETGFVAIGRHEMPAGRVMVTTWEHK